MEFKSICQVQFSNNRFAVCGAANKNKKVDITVFDVQTGAKILALNEDLKFENVSHFFLDREKIFFVENQTNSSLREFLFYPGQPTPLGKSVMVLRVELDQELKSAFSSF